MYSCRRINQYNEDDFFSNLQFKLKHANKGSFSQLTDSHCLL